MPTNRAKPESWDADFERSVAFYNDWFLSLAPDAYRNERVAAAASDKGMLAETNCLLSISPEQIRARPEILAALRMSTAPPIARDRLVGLAGVSKSLVVLFLCGYFDRGYLQYEAAEGIDWVWEHRVGDFEECGL